MRILSKLKFITPNENKCDRVEEHEVHFMNETQDNIYVPIHIYQEHYMFKTDNGELYRVEYAIKIVRVE